GFGPDLPLLLANRLFYLGLTLALGGLAVLLFARRERRALAPRRQARTALAMLTCGVVVAGLALPRFQAASAAVMLSGRVVPPAAVPLAVRDYRLDLRLDPVTGAEDGVALFTIRNGGKAPVATLPLYLNDGLRLRTTTLDGRPATVTSSAQFGRVALAPALAPGRSVAVRISYAGHYKLLHAQYGSIF